MSFFSLFLAWQDSFEIGGIGGHYSNQYYHVYGVGAPVQPSLKWLHSAVS